MFHQLKKILVVTSTGISGVLFTLAGLGQLELSQSLFLYIGLILLALAMLYYFLS